MNSIHRQTNKRLSTTNHDMNKEENQTFAKLFKKYRLRSEIETLSQFGDLLAQEGLVYENSLFTHWQKGDRVPKDRKILLAVISIFIKRKGMHSLVEANSLLSSVQMRDLNELEADELKKLSKQMKTGLAKADPYRFESFGKIMYFAAVSLLTNRFFMWIALLFVVQSAWFLRVNILRLQDSFEAYLLCWFYGFNALSGAIYAFNHAIKRTTARETVILRLLALGLCFQWLGLQIWTIHNVQGTVVPYPSLADLSYFSGLLCYLFAALFILNRHTYTPFTSISIRKIAVFLTPALAFIGFYSFFLQTFGLSIIRQATITLNLAYPLINAIPIMLIMYTLVFSTGIVDRITRVRYVGLILAFSFQFLADYFFVYTIQMKEFVNGGLADYFYATSYAAMSLAVTNYSHLLNYRSLKYAEWILGLARMQSECIRSIKNKLLSSASV